MSTPPVPRFWSRSLVRISSNRACLERFSSLQWTPARIPVPRYLKWAKNLDCFVWKGLDRDNSNLIFKIKLPRLDGQVRTYPRCSFHISSYPFSWRLDSNFLSPSQNRLKTAFMSPPFCIEITRKWSSSLTQTKKFLLSLCQIPRASGQSRALKYVK